MDVILTTVSKKSDAEKLAKALVAKKLAACVNIVRLGGSIYRWKGKVVKEKEFLLLIKTAKPYKKLERFIKKNHPYELPEIISFPITKGYKKYLDWLGRRR